jgi:hypothetical protein
MSAYLTANELADMIGCEPNSYACMRRWLKRHDWPFETNLRGFPKVSRAYHDARMSGLAQPGAPNADLIEPDFSMFKTA